MSKGAIKTFRIFGKLESKKIIMNFFLFAIINLAFGYVMIDPTRLLTSYGDNCNLTII